MLNISSCLVDKAIQHSRMRSGNNIPAFIHCIRFYGLCPFLVFRGNPFFLPAVHDGICKHIAYTLYAVFLYDTLRRSLWQTVSVKVFCNNPVNGIFAGNLCVTFYLCLCLFKLFLRLFLFIFRIGFFSFGE